MELETLVAKELGIEIEEKRLFSEKRYLVIIEIIKDEKRHVTSNVTPIADIQKAKKIAIKRAAIKISENDTMTFRVLELVFAEVPVTTTLLDNKRKYIIEPITSRWLEGEELSQLIKYENVPTTL